MIVPNKVNQNKSMPIKICFIYLRSNARKTYNFEKSSYDLQHLHLVAAFTNNKNVAIVNEMSSVSMSTFKDGRIQTSCSMTIQFENEK